MKKSLKKALILDFILMGFLTVLDQLTKIGAAGALKGKAPIVLIGGVLEFRYIENRGAAFGILQDARAFFLVITVLAMVLVLYALFRAPLDKRFLPVRILLVLIGAGALGNALDRAILSYVRDFIYFSLIDFPVFNVADIYVTCATFLLVLLVLIYYKEDSDFDWLSSKKEP